MSSEKLYKGFNHRFITEKEMKMPTLSKRHTDDIAPIVNNGKSVLHYINYSVVLSKSRKFPFFTASNIDGELFKKASRAKSWKKDKRAKEYQWGQELYSAEKSDFDKGHMVKREDVQWGETMGLAQQAADSTFYYSNAVPQHKDLNQEVWRRLEDYILHTETIKNNLKICVFTGPVLSENDPLFVTTVKGESVLLPIIFWKIVVFQKGDGQLYRVGFMMSQRRLFVENGIVEELEAGISENELFMQFDDAATYQVNVSLIEKIADIKLPIAIDSYTDERSIKLVLEEIDIDPELESDLLEQRLDFTIANIVL